MNSGLNSDNPALVAAFRSALLHQGILVLAVFGVLALAWAVTREWARPPGTRAPGRGDVLAEPMWRQVLRIGFGVLWILDGLLQAQPAMAGGLPAQVIKPAAASSPGWVQHLVNWAGTSWSYHPVQAAASVVWIQIGIGIWLTAGGGRPGLLRLTVILMVGLCLADWVLIEDFGFFGGLGTDPNSIPCLIVVARRIIRADGNVGSAVDRILGRGASGTTTPARAGWATRSRR